MGSTSSTVIVEARLLVREAFRSLMKKASYDVVCDVETTAEIGAAAVSDEPEIVILGARLTDDAVAEAVAIRKLWPDSKIILLYEHASDADLQKMLASEINGFVPVFASSDTFVGAVNTILTRDLRVMIATQRFAPTQPAGLREAHRSDIDVASLQSEGTGHDAISNGIVLMHGRTAVSNASNRPNLSNGRARDLPAVREHVTLSEREDQILNGVVKGHANKVIARTCDIAEATVKAHMKAVLRKIGVANRTQAAVWALKRGYTASGNHPTLPR